ncbi:hypothetical protein NAEGRDRAFT_62584 [Naegleria gruberi]|uniref:F-box domain-containing protein n=1 Tax=Naegleria gruberi TaxID=5762 RepID=D2V1H7_NAEGR|nr:uncharacterized protein NAEGRDRAFT_62584 [Naegleria gruberi]EFC49309.1 hypothetical protein NAEGRDRAFT_62584 [Naegleria gruberi]|eukprot:XP_002682053.1 hypothetical protein NAEGRDRAFT_62584 [Naegleria gruberi strain NEG-M]
MSQQLFNNDELYEILSFLPTPSLIHSTSLVSKQWLLQSRNIPLAISFYNRKMLNTFIYFDDDQQHEELFAFERKDQVEIRDLKIRSVKAHYMKDSSFKLLNSRKEFENVEELDFSYSKFNICIESGWGDERKEDEDDHFVWNYPKLKRFRLNEVKLGEELVKSIANSSSLSNLQVLELKSINLVRFQVEHLTSSEVLKNLTALDISSNILEEDGCELILTSKFAESLTSLNMNSCSPEFNEFTQGISQYFTRILSTFQNLKDLNYGRNCLRDEDLLKVESLRNLTSLDISMNYITEQSTSFFEKPIFNNLTNFQFFFNRTDEVKLYEIVMNNPTTNNLNSIVMVINDFKDVTPTFIELFDNDSMLNIKTLKVFDYFADNSFLRKPIFDNLTTLKLDFDSLQKTFFNLENCKFLKHLIYLDLAYFSGIDFRSLDKFACNLRSLRLENCSIDMKVLVACSFLPNITDLSLEWCILSGNDIRIFAECGKTEQLTKLTLDEPVITNINCIANNPENFKSLELLKVNCALQHENFKLFPKLTKLNDQSMF